MSTAVLAFLGLKFAVLATNLRAFPVLRAEHAPTPHRSWWEMAGSTGVSTTSPHLRAGAGGGGERISLLVPVRNEEANLRRTLAGFLAQPADEILLLDDGSTDDTADRVRALTDTEPRLRLLRGAALPPGWVGKNWACHQLAAAATGDLLVFCDADVTLADGALAAVRTEAAAQEAEVFSVFPRQQTATMGERILLPLIDDVLLCLLPHGLLRLPIPLAATANGQLLLFRRSAYDQLGGHRAVRRSVVEDVRFARLTRAAGLRLGLALGGDLVGVRMYEGYAAVVAGLGKSLLPAHGGSRLLMVATASWHLVAYTVPVLRVLARPRSAAAVTAVALGLLERVAVNAKTGRGAWWEAALVPLAPLAALPVYARAAGRTPPEWKGRSYP